MAAVQQDINDSNLNKTDDFWAEAESTYNASADNELDLVGGEFYIVIDTTDLGWWFCLDLNGIDGWAPATYLKRVSPQKNAQLQREYDQKMKDEEERRLTEKHTSPKVDDLNDYDVNMASSALKDEIIAKATSFAKRMKERELQNGQFGSIQPSSNNHMKQQQKKSNSNAVHKVPKVQNGHSLGGDYKYDENTDDHFLQRVSNDSNIMWSTDKKAKNRGKVLEYQRKEQEAKAQKIRKRLFYDELSQEEKDIDDQYRPKLKSIKMNPGIKQSSYIHKQYSAWKMEEILHYLVSTSRSGQNTFALVSVLGMFAQKLQGSRRYVLRQNAINILLFVLSTGGDKDVSIANMVCRAMTALCGETNLVLQHGSCEKQGLFYLVTAVRNSLRNPIFCCHAINCIVNLTNRNDKFRQYIITDPYNAKLVELVLDALELYRYANRHTKHDQCVQVQIAGCRALQNIAAHPMGQSLIGTKGVEMDDDGITESVLSALRNICISNRNANAFLESGISFMSTFLESDESPISCRLSVCILFRNLSCDPFIARKMIDEWTVETECIVIRLMANAEYGTDLYLAILRFLHTLLLGVYDKKIEFMCDLLEQQCIPMLIDGLEYDYNIEGHERRNQRNGKYKKLVMNIYDHIVMVLNCYYLSGEEMCVAFIVDEEENEMKSWIPGILISLATCYQGSVHMVWEIMKMFDAMTTDNVPMQMRLLQGGIVHLLCGTGWYRQRGIDPEAIRLGANVMLKLMQSYPHHKKVWMIHDDIPNIKLFIKFLGSDVVLTDYSQHIKGMERQLMYIG